MTEAAIRQSSTNQAYVDSGQRGVVRQVLDKVKAEGRTSLKIGRAHV